MIKKILKKRALLALIIILFVIIAGIVLFAHNNTHNSTIDNRVSQNNDNDLIKNKNYDEYRMHLTSYAETYVEKGEYDTAEAALKQITKNVPKEAINYDTYRGYWYLYSSKKDVQLKRKYAKLTADKLREDNQPEVAKQFDKEANSN